MFNYFGSKYKLAPTYQAPKHDIIVEPFAGSAQYAVFWLLERPSMRALLYDCDPLVVEAWELLLAATPDEIAGWSVTVGEPVANYLELANFGPPRKTINERCKYHFDIGKYRWARTRAALGDRVSVVCGDYRDVPDVSATWFVDPPYMDAGKWYASGNDLDYVALGEWCRSRRGQTIVTEAGSADWLPFLCHKSHMGAAGVRSELVWESDPTPTLFD